MKKCFRKHAAMNHPDKIGGSKISEETFMLTLHDYETLSKTKMKSI